MKYLVSILFLLLTGFSQDKLNGQEKDSVRAYELNEITVKGGLILDSKTINLINERQIENADASTISELSKLIPSLKMQTNSRGETLFYMRGSGDRQLSVMFEGLPLNIPWDNRIDLSLIPTDAVGQIGVTKGIPSIVYGPNTIGGVINIETKNLKTHNPERKISASLSENNYHRFSGHIIDDIGPVNYLLSAGYKNENGFPLPGKYSNSLNKSKFRENSYNESYNGFLKLSYDYDQRSNIGVSFSHIDAEKGVPSETDVSNPRYWQYPLWRRSSVALTGSHLFGGIFHPILSYSLAGSFSEMEINQYLDNTYTTLDDVERGDDKTYNGRIVLTGFLASHSLFKFSFNGYVTRHEESFLSDEFSKSIYSQNVYSAGLEYEYAKEGFVGLLGIGFEGVSTPDTGDKPSKKSSEDYSINTALIYSFSENLSLRVNFGRKTRFPTLRESFSGALGRFVLNPDLKAESATSAELSLGYNYPNLSGDVNLFITYLKDGIVRQSLEGGKFQRVNKDEIRTLGLEVYSAINVTKDLILGVNFSILNSLAKNEWGNFKDTLEYKPKYITGVDIDYTPVDQVKLVVEANYMGEEFGLKEGTLFFQRLPDYFLLNGKIAYMFSPINDLGIEAYLRINNILDKLYFPQWSLPAPGRQFFAGLSFKF